MRSADFCHARRWTTAAGPPAGRISPSAPENDHPGRAPELPPPGEPISFDAHVKPLFRDQDRRSMRFAFDLWSYDDVVSHAFDVLDRVRSGSMPCDGAWPPEQVDMLQRWVDTDTPP